MPYGRHFRKAGIDYDSAEADFRASVEVPLDVDGARKIFKLVDALEDSDDVQNVYTNIDLSDEVLAALERLIAFQLNPARTSASGPGCVLMRGSSTAHR